MSSDLADQIDDYICTFDGVGDLTMDTLAMLIFAWAVLALFLVWLCKFLYNKYVVKKTTATGAADTSKYGVSPSEKLRKSEPKELSTSKDIKVSWIFAQHIVYILFWFFSVFALCTVHNSIRNGRSWRDGRWETGERDNRYFNHSFFFVRSFISMSWNEITVFFLFSCFFGRS